MENKFQNDKERIDELKSCLEECHKILSKSRRLNMTGTVRTLIQDTLSRYKEDKKFTTATTKKYEPLDFLDD